MDLRTLLAVGLLLGACAHGDGRGREDAEAWGAVDDALLEDAACIAIPTSRVARTDYDMAVHGIRAAGGGSPLQAEALRALDAFVAIGFLSPSDEADAGQPGHVTRRYRVTDAGRPHYRPLISQPRHSRQRGFCYGRKNVAERIELTPVWRGPCSTSRQARYSYRYVDLPAWVEDPRIAAAFPDRLGAEDAAKLHVAEMGLELGADGWRPGFFDYIHVSCTPAKVRRLRF